MLKRLNQGLEAVFGEQPMYLIGGLQLLCLHLPEDIVGSAKCSHFGVTHFHVCRQTDEPQAVAVTEQALGPQLRDGRVLLSYLLG